MTDVRAGLPSASEMYRIVSCPGYLQLKAELHKQPGIGSKPKDAQFGDDVHHLLSGQLKEMDTGERAAWVAKQCEKIRDKLRLELLGDEYSWAAEKRFWLTSPSGEKLFSAQLDYVAAYQSKWLLIDFKSLPGQVDPSPSNWQLLSQAVCLADDDDTRNQVIPLHTIDEVYAAIVQPLISNKPEVVKFGMRDLIRAKDMMLKKLDEAKTPNAPRIPGSHCKYCICSAHCDVAAADLLAVIPKTNLGVAHLSPEHIAAMIPRFATIEKLLKDIKDRAKALAAEGQLPGYSIEEREGARYFTSVQAARDTFKDYITKEEIVSMLNLPLGKLRELFVERYSKEKGTDKVEAGNCFDKLVEPICQRERSQKRLQKI